MKPILFYSDLHISEERHAEADLVLTEVGRLAKKYGAIIANGGDTHPIRGLIKTASHDLLTKHYTQWHDDGLIQVIDIGNHDQEDREGEVHPMRSFAKFSGWTVVSEPQIVEMGGVPWAVFPYMAKEKVQPAINRLRGKAKYALVHWGILGAKRNDWNTDTTGIPVEWLSCFKQVFSGHYHYRNAIENVQYIGSPFQHTHSEANQPKGVILYDYKKINFIEIKGTPKHYSVEYKIEDDGVTLEGDVENITNRDFVKVKVTGDSELVSHVSHDDVRKHFDCAELKFDRKGRVKAHSRLNLDSTSRLDPLTLMQKYVDFVDTTLDKKMLMQVGKGLVDELHS